MHHYSKDFVSRASIDELEQETADKSRSSSIIPIESFVCSQSEGVSESPLFKLDLKKQVITPVFIENITEEFHSEYSENFKGEQILSFIDHSYSIENINIKEDAEFLFKQSPGSKSESNSLEFEYSKTEKSSTIFEMFSSAYGFLKSVPQSPCRTDGSQAKSFETFDPRIVTERKDLGKDDLMKTLKKIEAESCVKEEKREETLKEVVKEKRCFCVECYVF